MADTKRLTVKKTLTTWLEGITPANGYQHDLTGKVFRGRAVFGESDEPPLITILESPAPDRDVDEAGEGRFIREDFVLLVQGWAAQPLATSDHPTDAADLLLGDIKKRLGELIGNDVGPQEMKEWHNLFGLVSSVRVEPGVSRPPDEISPLAYCYLRVVLGFVERIDDPYGV